MSSVSMDDQTTAFFDALQHAYGQAGMEAPHEVRLFRDAMADNLVLRVDGHRFAVRLDTPMKQVRIALFRLAAAEPLRRIKEFEAYEEPHLVDLNQIRRGDRPSDGVPVL